ncbi:hypothetical protein [Virgibacillus siamensis]|uniref:hypothetical protein n=1 Tax=Virgibacillus siamensis TaxID=480071 RepID=UPI00158E0BA4|nr:hypothetical protein [Virgibacillus siamensis]
MIEPIQTKYATNKSKFMKEGEYKQYIVNNVENCSLEVVEQLIKRTGAVPLFF